MTESVVPHQLADLVKQKADGMTNQVIQGLFNDLCEDEVKLIKKDQGNSCIDTELASLIRDYVRNKLVVHKLKHRYFRWDSDEYYSIDDSLMFQDLKKHIKEQKLQIRELIAKEKQFFAKVTKI